MFHCNETHYIARKCLDRQTASIYQEERERLNSPRAAERITGDGSGELWCSLHKATAFSNDDCLAQKDHIWCKDFAAIDSS